MFTTALSMVCLPAIYWIYKEKIGVVHVGQESDLPPDAFAERKVIKTDEALANRVAAGLNKLIPESSLNQLYYAYLSELPKMEDYLIKYMRYALDRQIDISIDNSHAAVLWVVQTARKVWREKHRMEAFVRFEFLPQNLFYATVEPDYNVLPVITKHFQSRYADQDWMIYDVRRKYGIRYEVKTGEVNEVQLSEKDVTPEESSTENSAAEPAYQQLWRDYFHSTGIPARRNMRLHLQHVPVRYWKYLTEKRVEF